MILIIIIPFIPFAYIYFKRWLEDRDIERGMISFLNSVNSRLMVDDNILKALYNSIETTNSVHIRSKVKAFCEIMLHSGNKAKAFEGIANTRNKYFNYIFINIEQVMDNWGDCVELMRELENEFITVQVELNKGRVELQNDKMLTVFGLGIAAMTGVNIILEDSGIQAYYAKRPFLALILIAISAFGCAILWNTKIK